MESDEVDDSDSGNIGEERYDLSSPFVYTKIFRDSFPLYLSYGMTPEQFWDDDPMLAKYYKKAHENKRDYDNQMAWLQGAYIYEVMVRVHQIYQMGDGKTKPKLEPYLDKPIDIHGNDEKSEEDIAREKMEKMKAAMMNNMAIINRKFESKGDK